MSEDPIQEDILKFIKGINYGELLITIHDSRVVQVEKREKKRFDARKRLPDRQS